MRHKLFTLAISMLFFIFAANAQKQSTSLDKTPLAPTQIEVSAKAQWDVLFTFDAVEAASPGIETNGTYFYTTTWNAGNFHRYDMDGANPVTFTITGVSSIRDLAYVESTGYFYGSDATMTIQIMDLDNEASIGTITVDAATGITGVRHIAYDPTLDGGAGGFWVGNWAELAAIDMSGNSLVANSETPDVTSAYGSAYDNWTDPANPKLWIATQPGSPSDAVFAEFDINTLTLTGTVHDAVADVPGADAAALSGGACTYEAGGLFILAGSLQQDPNLVFGYELAVTADPTAPGEPTAFTATPDAGGALTVDLAWTNPDVDVNGDPLTDLTSIDVYLNDDPTPIYTNASPTIGGAETYTATAPAGGMHTFKVVGTNASGAGIPATTSTFVGEDIPAAPGNIVLAVTDMDATVTWEAPTEGANGAYFSGTGLTYDVVRYPDDTLVSDDQTELTFTETITSAGNYSYEVIPSNATGVGVSGMSNTETIGDVLVYDFEAGMPDSFTLIDGDCGWMTGTDGSSSYFSIPAHSTYAYANDDACNGDMSDVWMITPFVDFTGVDAPFVQFESYSNNDIFTIKASTDGANWTDVQVLTPDNSAWKTETVDLSAYANEPAVQIAFHYNDDGAWGYGWAVDDILIPGALSGAGYLVTFNVDDGADPIEGANININGTDLTTDASGVATIELFDGEYIYTVTMDGYAEASDTITVAGAAVSETVTLNALYAVTFNVDMSDAIVDGDFDPAMDTLIVAGSMNGWMGPGTDEAMFMDDADEDSIYTLEMDLINGDYEYKYFNGAGWNGGEWEGGDNRTFTVADTAVVLDDVWAEGVGIDNTAEALEFNIYPNPTNGILHIEVDGNTEVSVINAIGQTINTVKVNGHSILDLSNNASGVYFIRVASENKVATKRIIVQ